MARRGFAMPVVVILTLVAGVAIAVLLERHAMQSFGAARRGQHYRDYHVGRGIKEAVTAWLTFAGGGSISLENALDSEGRAFELRLTDGEPGRGVEVFLFEAQGRPLGEFAGLSKESAALGSEILKRLREKIGEDELRRVVRRDGPLAVSVNHAKPEVLRAVIEAATDGGPGSAGLADDIVRARSVEPLDEKKIAELLGNSEITVERRARVTQVLTSKPVLWRVVAVSNRGRETEVRYEGLAVLSRGGVAAGDRLSAVQHPSSMISWERVD